MLYIPMCRYLFFQRSRSGTISHKLLALRIRQYSAEIKVIHITGTIEFNGLILITGGLRSRVSIQIAFETVEFLGNRARKRMKRPGEKDLQSQPAFGIGTRCLPATPELVFKWVTVFVIGWSHHVRQHVLQLATPASDRPICQSVTADAASSPVEI